MALFEIDVYENQREAQIKAEQHRQAGRTGIVIKQYTSFTLFECAQPPCIVKYDRDGSPLYLVFSEG